MKTARDVMSREIRVAPAGTSMQEVAAAMRDHDIGMVPVVDEGRLLGVVTDRDLTVRGTAEGRDPATAKVEDLMSTGAVRCREDDDLETIGGLMSEHRVRRVLVVGEDDRLAGIVTIGDLAQGDGPAELAGRVEEEITEP